MSSSVRLTSPDLDSSAEQRTGARRIPLRLGNERLDLRCIV